MVTVLGAAGFIGSKLTEALKNSGLEDVYAPLRQDGVDFLDEVLKRELGHVFYCIGLTANFRSRPFDTVDAHVCLLRRLLKQGRFGSLTYLSSTRVYEGSRTTHESSVLQVEPEKSGHLYNLSKLMGESMCLAAGRKARVVRLSNVFGPAMPEQNFISTVLREAASTGQVQFMTSANSAKDYVSINDVVRWLPQIARRGVHDIYNVASGTNLSNAEIASLLEEKGVKVNFAENLPVWSFPKIDTKRLEQEFGAARTTLSDEFDLIFSNYKQPHRGHQ